MREQAGKAELEEAERERKARAARDERALAVALKRKALEAKRVIFGAGGVLWKTKALQLYIAQAPPADLPAARLSSSPTDSSA